MFNWDEEWNISFAGCGFRSIYYVGALSCLLERVPRLVHGASRICGASSGCLVAAALAVGIPMEQICADILATAKEARKHRLGVFHPTFSLLRTVRDSLLERLPEDAHLRASGRLCVSLTRLTDCRNVLVSHFDSREELIQVLMCSCFFPVYCGFVPPSYRGVLFMDGALSDNMPLRDRRNTITVAPFSGENDICPRQGPLCLLSVHYANVGVQICTDNVHRVCTSFLPPSPETLAEICHSGYMDALRFLRQNGLIGEQVLTLRPVEEKHMLPLACCALAKEQSMTRKLKRLRVARDKHWWLEPKTVENLPFVIRKVLCGACREGQGGRWSRLAEFLPVQVVLGVLTPLTVSIEIAFSLVKSAILSGPAVLRRLFPPTASLYKHAQRGGDSSSVGAEQRSCVILQQTLTLNPEDLRWDDNGNLAPLPTGDPPTSKVTLKYKRKWTHRPWSRMTSKDLG